MKTHRNVLSLAPRLLRRQKLFFIFATAALSFAITSPCFAIASNVLTQQTNDIRHSYQLQKLFRSTTLDQAAKSKAESMFREQFFNHTSPSGKPFWSWLGAGRTRFTSLGENLASGYPTAPKLLSAWMASGGHRKNILDARYTHLGIGIRSGVLFGKRTTIVVAIFGKKKTSTPFTAPLIN